MSTIKSFRAVRPDKSVADKVAALPYDVMNTAEAREMVKGNPLSFLNIDRAEVLFDDLSKSPYDADVYLAAHDRLYKQIDEGIYIRDEKPYLYIYQLTMDGRVQNGIVCCTSVDEYINGTIKRHELTLEKKEQDRINHVDNVNANTGPIYLTYPGKTEINSLVLNWEETNAPVYDFTSEDGITHRAWVIDDEAVIAALISLFETVPNLYIADGHHRNASAVKVGLKRREQNPDYTGDEEFNFYLSVVFPKEELKIFDYNRVVKDLNGYSESEFIEQISKNFDVTEISSDVHIPDSKYVVSMYLAGKWYRLFAKENIRELTDTVEKLDVSILQNYVLTPILGIGDPRTDSRIDFVGGIRGLKELEKRVDSGEMKVAFAMFPTSLDELLEIADNGLIMPPKSTWFEPKLRSGLFIHEL